MAALCRWAGGNRDKGIGQESAWAIETRMAMQRADLRVGSGANGCRLLFALHGEVSNFSAIFTTVVRLNIAHGSTQTQQQHKGIEDAGHDHVHGIASGRVKQRRPSPPWCCSGSTPGLQASGCSEQREQTSWSASAGVQANAATRPPPTRRSCLVMGAMLSSSVSGWHLYG